MGKIKLVTFVSSPEGIKSLQDEFPDVDIITGSIDDGLGQCLHARAPSLSAAFFSPSHSLVVYHLRHAPVASSIPRGRALLNDTAFSSIVASLA